MANPLTPNEIQRLLDELCLQGGFCLPPPEQARLRREPPQTIDAFTDAVMIAEGLDPELHLYLRKGVRAAVAEHFRAACDPNHWFNAEWPPDRPKRRK